MSRLEVNKYLDTNKFCTIVTSVLVKEYLDTSILGTVVTSMVVHQSQTQSQGFSCRIQWKLLAVLWMQTNTTIHNHTQPYTTIHNHSLPFTTIHYHTLPYTILIFTDHAHFSSDNHPNNQNQWFCSFNSWNIFVEKKKAETNF